MLLNEGGRCSLTRFRQTASVYLPGCVLAAFLAFLVALGPVCHGLSHTKAAVDGPAIWTQRGINEITASLEDAYLRLSVDNHLRHLNEPLRAYCERLAARMPAESPGKYRARLNGYLAVILHVVAVTRVVRAMPALKAQDAANVNAWTAAVAATRKVAGQVGFLRKMVGAALGDPASHQATVALGAELADTILSMQDARQALRDVRP